MVANKEVLMERNIISYKSKLKEKIKINESYNILKNSILK